MKILLIRNDKLGDFVLALPSFFALKQSLPDAQLVALVPEYTSEIAKLCSALDRIIIDKGKNSKADFQELVEQIKSEKFDAVISYFSNSYNAKLVRKSKIKTRFAPAIKLAQFAYNHKIKQNRSQSIKPEYEYNLDLTQAFLQFYDKKMHKRHSPFLKFDAELIAQRKAKLITDFNLNANLPIFVAHPATGGTGKNLTPEEYADFLNCLKQKINFNLLISCIESEKSMALKLKNALNFDANVLISQNGLADFALSLASTNFFVAGSTGTLHLAGALDIPTLGFFQANRTSSALRWRPLNSQNKHLAISASQTGEKTDPHLIGIDLKNACAQTLDFLQKLEVKN